MAHSNAKENSVHTNTHRLPLAAVKSHCEQRGQGDMGGGGREGLSATSLGKNNQHDSSSRVRGCRFGRELEVCCHRREEKEGECR